MTRHWTRPQAVLVRKLCTMLTDTQAALLLLKPENASEIMEDAAFAEYVLKEVNSVLKKHQAAMLGMARKREAERRFSA